MPSRTPQPGERVRIAQGAFESMTGVVIRPEAPSNHVWVEVSIYGRAVPVVLEPKQVERLDGPPAVSPLR